mgnify:CR=1 FL=1
MCKGIARFLFCCDRGCRRPEHGHSVKLDGIWVWSFRERGESPQETDTIQYVHRGHCFEPMNEKLYIGA